MTRAVEVARGSTCDRAAVGCVLVQPLIGEVGRGTNTAARGALTCADAGHLMHDGHCCRSTHAEIWALVDAAAQELSVWGATAYVTHYPCISCAHALVAHGIARIVYQHAYRPHAATAYILDAAGVRVEQWSPDGRE